MDPLLFGDDQYSATPNRIDWIRGGLTMTCGLLAGFLLGLTVDYVQALFLPKLLPSSEEHTIVKTEKSKVISKEASPLTRDFTHSDEPCKFCQSGFFTLRIGKEKKEFYVHKQMLRARSKYFERILAEDSEWQEAKDNQVTWQNEKVEVVSIWIDWLYGKPISIEKDWYTLVECYSFATQRLLTDFKNAAMDAFRERHKENNWHIGAITLLRLKELDLMGTPMWTCGLRSMVKTLLKQPKDWNSDKWKLDRGQLDKAMEDPNFAKAVIAAVLDFQTTNWENPHRLVGCQFHEHEAGEKCLVKEG